MLKCYNTRKPCRAKLAWETERDTKGCKGTTFFSFFSFQWPGRGGWLQVEGDWLLVGGALPRRRYGLSKSPGIQWDQGY